MWSSCGCGLVASCGQLISECYIMFSHPLTQLQCSTEPEGIHTQNHPGYCRHVQHSVPNSCSMRLFSCCTLASSLFRQLVSVCVIQLSNISEGFSPRVFHFQADPHPVWHGTFHHFSSSSSSSDPVLFESHRYEVGRKTTITAEQSSSLLRKWPWLCQLWCHALCIKSLWLRQSCTEDHKLDFHTGTWPVRVSCCSEQLIHEM